MRQHNYGSHTKPSWDTLDLLMDLEERLSIVYRVHPVDSRRAFEEYDFEDGSIWRAAHEVFKVRIPDTQGLHVLSGTNVLLNKIKEKFPEGAPIVWRKRPVLEEDDQGPYILLRLGCIFKDHQPIAKGSHND